MNTRSQTEIDLEELSKKLAEKLSDGSIREIKEYIEHGELGLAYDVLVFEFSKEKTLLSDHEKNEIAQVAKKLGIDYPKLSTGPNNNDCASG